MKPTITFISVISYGKFGQFLFNMKVLSLVVITRIAEMGNLSLAYYDIQQMGFHHKEGSLFTLSTKDTAFDGHVE